MVQNEKEKGRGRTFRTISKDELARYLGRAFGDLFKYAVLQITLVLQVCQMKSEKYSHPPFSKKKTFYLWVHVPWRPKFRRTDPEFCVEFESAPGSGFHARDGELHGSGVSGSEDYRSPFRGGRPNLVSDSGCTYPKPKSTHFLAPMGFLARCTEPNRVTAKQAARAQKMFGYASVK